jgi:hypothetical protein
MLVGVSGAWRNFFVSIFNVCNALTMSGTTANRPTSGLWTGRMYFDTTLGIPIWYTPPDGWIRPGSGMTVWTTIHGTEQTDLEAIEQKFIAQSDAEYLEHCKTLEIEDKSCLG